MSRRELRGLDVDDPQAVFGRVEPYDKGDAILRIGRIWRMTLVTNAKKESSAESASSVRCETLVIGARHASKVSPPIEAPSGLW